MSDPSPTAEACASSPVVSHKDTLNDIDEAGPLVVKERNESGRWRARGPAQAR